jgi:fructose-1,6-bisphosphatase/inositol monophosphatase family enzyme
VTQSADGFRHETHVAIDAVERALELARRGVGTAVTTAKGGRDLVTATDVAVEDAVRGIVRAAVGAVVVGEERGGESPADDSPYWLLDPICGTRNFASGIPLYLAPQVRNSSRVYPTASGPKIRPRDRGPDRARVGGHYG